MATRNEVRQITQILDEEGFGALAGEILIEISLGREIDKLTSPDSSFDTSIERQEIPENEQITRVIEIIRMRLVEPVRAFAEAEKIAGELIESGPIRIRFIDPDSGSELEPISQEDPGNSLLADKLDDFLNRLPRMIDPDQVAGP